MERVIPHNKSLTKAATCLHKLFVQLTGLGIIIKGNSMQGLIGRFLAEQQNMGNNSHKIS